MIRVTLDGRKVLAQENLIEGNVGRIREISEGPDGYIYFSTSNRDGRATPAKDDDRIPSPRFEQSLTLRGDPPSLADRPGDRYRGRAQVPNGCVGTGCSGVGSSA